MRVQQNTDVQINITQNQDKSVSVIGAVKAGHKNGTPGSVSGANLKNESLIQQRQDMAKKQAMKVVADAFGGEKKLDTQMQSIKDEIKRLQDEINEKTAMLGENDKKIQELQENGVGPENEELLERLKLRDALTADIDQYKAIQKGNVQGFADIKRERLKSQDMLKAQDAAEDIMEASNDETIALLTQEAVEHVDEEQKEREEEAKEAVEEKKEEKKEEAKKLEKEAMQQEMIENIKEHAAMSQRTSADVKRAMARKERAEAEGMENEAVQKTIISDATSMEDAQNTVNSEITNILNRLSLLSNDVKGSAIDNQI